MKEEVKEIIARAIKEAGYELNREYGLGKDESTETIRTVLRELAENM